MIFLHLYLTFFSCDLNQSLIFVFILLNTILNEAIPLILIYLQRQVLSITQEAAIFTHRFHLMPKIKLFLVF